jgi:hypothetical protein
MPSVGALPPAAACGGWTNCTPAPPWPSKTGRRSASPRCRGAIRTPPSRSAAGQPPPEPEPEAPTLVHCTTLPWLHFTSFTHARDPAQGTDNPKLAFGQLRQAEARWWLPLCVDVHHALVDGVHVGRFVQAFEALLQSPDDWLGG